MKRSFAFAAIAAIVVGAVPQVFGASATSATSIVWTNPDESIQWKTVMSASAPVALDWPAGAASAQLTVSWHGMTLASATVTDTTAREAVIFPTLPATFGDEKVVDVEVKYLDGSDNVLDSASASLGFVTGVGSNPTRCMTETNGWTWQTFDASAVTQIPEDATSLTVDGAAKDFNAPGWWELYRFSVGPHTLVMTTAEGEKVATLSRLSGGMSIIFR